MQLYQHIHDASGGVREVGKVQAAVQSAHPVLPGLSQGFVVACVFRSALSIRNGGGDLKVCPSLCGHVLDHVQPPPQSVQRIQLFQQGGSGVVPPGRRGSGSDCALNLSCDVTAGYVVAM